MVTLNEFLVLGGFVTNLIGVVVSAALTVIVVKYQNKQRDTAERFHGVEIDDNLKSMAEVFDDVIHSSRHDSQDPEEIELATYALEKYYKHHATRMSELAQNTETHIDQLLSMDPERRVDLLDAVRALRWLVEEYYPPRTSFNTKKRIWAKQYDALFEKRNVISRARKRIEEASLA